MNNTELKYTEKDRYQSMGIALLVGVGLGFIILSAIRSKE